MWRRTTKMIREPQPWTLPPLTQLHGTQEAVFSAKQFRAAFIQILLGFAVFTYACSICLLMFSFQRWENPYWLCLKKKKNEPAWHPYNWKHRRTLTIEQWVFPFGHFSPAHLGANGQHLARFTEFSSWGSAPSPIFSPSASCLTLWSFPKTEWTQQDALLLALRPTGAGGSRIELKDQFYFHLLIH